MALSAIVGVAVVIVIGLVFSTQLSAQIERNTFITERTKILIRKSRKLRLCGKKLMH